VRATYAIAIPATAKLNYRWGLSHTAMREWDSETKNQALTASKMPR